MSTCEILYENDDESNDEFVQLLSLIENLIYTYPGSHVLVEGDFKVDFNRHWVDMHCPVG